MLPAPPLISWVQFGSAINLSLRVVRFGRLRYDNRDSIKSTQMALSKCGSPKRPSETHRNAHAAAGAVAPWQNHGLARAMFTRDQKSGCGADACADHDIIPMVLVGLNTRQADKACGDHGGQADVGALAIIQCCRSGKCRACVPRRETLPVTAVGAQFGKYVLQTCGHQGRRAK